MDTTNKIILILNSIPKAETGAALDAYNATNPEFVQVIAAPVTDVLAPWNTQKAVDEIAAGNWPGGKPRTGEPRGILIAQADKKSALNLMRAFKSVQPAGADTAFAIVTKTGLTWTVDEYLKHIRKEHEYMKTADPSADPDMKRVD